MQNNGLEIEKAAARTAKQSKYKLAGQLFLVCLLILGAVGLTGGHLLGRNTLSSYDDNITVNYPRVGRIEIPQQLDIILNPRVATNVVIWFDNDYLRKMSIKEILPQPVRSKLVGKNIYYFFDTASTSVPIIISFLLEPQVRGFVTAKFGILNQQDVMVQQFIYP